MKKSIASIALLSALVGNSVSQAQVGIMPVPQVDTATIETSVEIVRVSGQPTEYIYRYSVTNPSSSTANFYKFSIDVSGVGRDFRRPMLTTVPKRAGTATRPIDEEIDFFFPFFSKFGDGVVPIGLECPPGWNGGLRKYATAVCYSANGSPEIEPGQTMSGFAIHSRFPPMLREVDNSAFWTVVVDSHTDELFTGIDQEAAYEVLDDLRQPQMTLGPTYLFPNQREHYLMFVRDFVEVKTLGWIPNLALADQLTDLIDEVGELFRTGQGTAAKLRLDDVVSALATTTDTDILPNASTFLLVNIDSIQEFGSNTFPNGGLSRRVRFSPAADIVRIGGTYELEAFVYRLNNSDFRSGVIEEPDPTATVYFGCDDSAPVDPGVDPCPNVPLAGNPSPTNRTPVPVDANGIAVFSYVGTRPGRDHIEICIDPHCEGVLGRPVVDWFTDVDLAVTAFSPPLIKAASGEVIRFTDITTNLGDGVSPPSITRYYISEDEVINPATATVVGERAVPSLQPGDSSERVDMDFSLPPGFPIGVHNLIACADANQSVEESNELNNCSNVSVEGFEFTAIPVADFEDLTRVTIDDVSISEGDSGITNALIDVTLSGISPGSDIVVGYDVVDGTATTADDDYQGTSGTLTFQAGPVPQSLQVTVPVIGDISNEDDETIHVNLEAISGDFIFEDRQGEVTVLNDDSLVVLDCTTAIASPSRLWPPNHKYHTIQIAGILDSAGNEASVSVQSVFQDELVDGDGDGNTQPDAAIDSSGGVHVRAERSGLEDGRVYEIGFTATSNDGASCSGTVMVGVPHDRGQDSVPVDSGVRYDSTSTTN